MDVNLQRFLGLLRQLDILSRARAPPFTASDLQPLVARPIEGFLIGGLVDDTTAIVERAEDIVDDMSHQLYERSDALRLSSML